MRTHPREADIFLAGGESRVILLSLLPRFEAASAARGPAVNDIPRKSLKSQSAPSSKTLTKLDVA
jgi:hypothetical protein